MPCRSPTKASSSTRSLQEAKASSEIENIVTTQDELFQASLFPEGPGSPAAKEVAYYRDALKRGFDLLLSGQGLLTNNSIIEIFRVPEAYNGGLPLWAWYSSSQRGGSNDRLRAASIAADIGRHMNELERFINDDI